MNLYHTEKIANSQSIGGVFPIEKKAGETLAVLIERFREERGLGTDVPVTYAGRLDPMASGLVILLTREKCKEKDAYLGLDKTYTFEVLFGVATDTFDMLGLVTDEGNGMPQVEDIQRAIDSVRMQTTFPYPPYSSKPVDGIPLFMRAKTGTLPETMPTMQGEIKELLLKGVRTETIENILSDAIEIIQRVEGEFRQKEIMERWKTFLEKNTSKEYMIATLEATVSSGVYIRTIATLLGEALGVPALAYSIDRTRVGEYRK